MASDTSAQSITPVTLYVTDFDPRYPYLTSAIDLYFPAGKYVGVRDRLKRYNQSYM